MYLMVWTYMDILHKTFISSEGLYIEAVLSPYLTEIHALDIGEYAIYGNRYFVMRMQ